VPVRNMDARSLFENVCSVCKKRWRKKVKYSCDAAVLDTLRQQTVVYFEIKDNIVCLVMQFQESEEHQGCPHYDALHVLPSHYIHRILRKNCI